jgi:hypothetical protein
MVAQYFTALTFTSIFDISLMSKYFHTPLIAKQCSCQHLTRASTHTAVMFPDYLGQPLMQSNVSEHVDAMQCSCQMNTND